VYILWSALSNIYFPISKFPFWGNYSSENGEIHHNNIWRLLRDMTFTTYTLLLHGFYFVIFVRKREKFHRVTLGGYSWFCFLELTLSYYYISYLSYVFTRKTCRILYGNTWKLPSHLLVPTCTLLPQSFLFRLNICLKTAKYFIERNLEILLEYAVSNLYLLILTLQFRLEFRTRSARSLIW